MVLEHTSVTGVQVLLVRRYLNRVTVPPSRAGAIDLGGVNWC